LTAGVRYSRDGSYFRLRDLSGGRHEVEHPDGQIHSFDANGRITEMRDRFGNYLRISYSSAIRWTLSDSAGRTHDVFLTNRVLDRVIIPMVDRVKLATFGGQWSNYHFTYNTSEVERPCFFSDPSNHINARPRLPFLTKVSLPDSSFYEIPLSGYELPSGSSCHWNGAISRLRLPTRGQIEWQWRAYRFPTGQTLPNDEKPPKFFQRSMGVKRRILRDANGVELGRWVYAPQIELVSGQEPVEMSNTVTDPLGFKTKHYFSAYKGGLTSNGAAHRFDYGLPFTSKAHAGTPFGFRLSTEVLESGLVQQSTYVRYERDQGEAQNTNAAAPENYDFNRRLASQRTNYKDGTYSVVTFSQSLWPQPAGQPLPYRLHLSLRQSEELPVPAGGRHGLPILQLPPRHRSAHRSGCEHPWPGEYSDHLQVRQPWSSYPGIAGGWAWGGDHLCLPPGQWLRAGLCGYPGPGKLARRSPRRSPVPGAAVAGSFWPLVAGETSATG
jgi:hypothetical protein